MAALAIIDSTNVPRGVDLWVVTLADTDIVTKKMLKKTEDLTRYEQIIPQKRRRHFLFRRVVRDFVLGQYVTNYAVEKDAAGKPYVIAQESQHRIHFSASSSAEICVIGVSGEELGVDVESRRQHVDMVGICERFVPGFAQIKNQFGIECLLRQLAMCAWCRIESFVKLRGHTLHAMLLEKEELMSGWLQQSHHTDVVVSARDYVCAISQANPFDIRNIYTINFSNIHCEHGD